MNVSDTSISALNFFEKLKEMCDSLGACSKCPITDICETDLGDVIDHISTKEILEIINKVENFGKQTYKDVFLEKFPNAPIDIYGVPEPCVHQVFGKQHRSDDCGTSCTNCWNRLYEEKQI